MIPILPLYLPNVFPLCTCFFLNPDNGWFVAPLLLPRFDSCASCWPAAFASQQMLWMWIRTSSTRWEGWVGELPTGKMSSLYDCHRNGVSIWENMGIYGLYTGYINWWVVTCGFQLETDMMVFQWDDSQLAMFNLGWSQLATIELYFLYSNWSTRPGKHTKNDGKSPFYSCANQLFRLGHGFNSYVNVYQ